MILKKKQSICAGGPWHYNFHSFNPATNLKIILLLNGNSSGKYLKK